MLTGTIVSPTRLGHKTRLATLILAGALSIPLATLPTGALAAQQVAHPLRATDLLMAAGAGAVYVAPHALDINDHAPSCAPCARGGVPWFDRWAIHEPRPAWSDASSATVLALAALTALDFARQGPSAYGDVAYIAESAAWALGVTESLKAVSARKRPVLYTSEAPAVAGDLDQQRSMPSGHTSVAFALATAYVLARKHRGEPLRWRTWTVAAAATTVAAMRVMAAEHFPSDVAAGALVGTATALAVYVVRF